MKTQFFKEYTLPELGEKLAQLRPEEGEKKKEGFSLNELNERLAKLRKMEEAAVADSAGDAFSVLRESLRNIGTNEDHKKSLCLFHFPLLYLLIFNKQFSIWIYNGYSI